MQNFGKITNAFNEVLVEGITSNDKPKKQLFKEYVKQIKENKALKAQFMIYEDIGNKIETNELKANLFLQEHIGLLNQFTKKELSEANTKLVSILSSPDYISNYEKQELHENISTLIFNDRNSKNIDKIIEATVYVIDYMKNNTIREVKEAIDLPLSMVTTIMVDKYNTKYETLEEDEKRVIKAIIEGDDEKKLEIYTEVLKGCISSINEKLGTAETDVKEKLLSVKDKLLNDKQTIDEAFEKNISKLMELRESLK